MYEKKAEKSQIILKNKSPSFENQKGDIFSLFYYYEHYRYYKPEVIGISEEARQRLLPQLPSYPEGYPLHKEDYYDQEFVERMDVAEYSLNQLGLVRIRHQFPIREEFLTDNLMMFRVFSADFMNTVYKQKVYGVCEAAQYSHFIVCQNDMRQFKYSGAGILIHEIFHLLGISHLHQVNRQETNQLLIDNTSIKDDYSLIDRGVDYTPLSLFSIMHAQLPQKGISLDETRVRELLVDSNFSSEQIANYFSLLKVFGGLNKLCTYQDIQLLAQAVYTRNPVSLMGHKFQLPYYHFIDAVYAKAYQKEQLIELIHAFRAAENFTYSLFAQKDILLEFRIQTPFVANLINEFKLVSLNDQRIHCMINNTINFLNISDDCILQANIPQATKFNLTIEIEDTYNKIERTIIFLVKNPMQLLLLGDPRPVYTSRNTTIDLRYLCAAVAYPAHDEIQCAMEGLPEDWSLNDCLIVRDSLQNKTIRVNFFNSAANKTCEIEVVPRNEDIVLSPSVNSSAKVKDIIDYSSVNDSVSNEQVSMSSNQSIQANFPIVAAYWQDKYTVNESQFTKNLLDHADLSEQLMNHLKHVFYITGIPVLQGVFDGVIDETQLSAIKKSILKLIPRVGLISLGYFSTLQIPILLFYSFYESFIVKYLIEKQRIGVNHLLNGLLFLIVTELEYGFSNLWELSDKLEFWPELSARFNQLFLQFLFAPALKSASYLTTLNFLKFIHSNNKQEQNEQDIDKVLIDNRSANSASNDCSFFNSLSNAASVVFSKKIVRLPRLFVREISDNLVGRESQGCSRIYASK